MSYKIFKIGEYIRRNLHNPPTKEMVCEKFSITDYSLRKGFKENFGLNFGEYTRKHKIKTAARLLHNSEKSISAISECVGFRNHSRFAEAFKNQYGLSPKTFRDACKQSISKLTRLPTC
ncbi:MAG: hypothetical protein CMI23_10795 [Opitutae bacterium]|nr:hypothetical protein [Opitutae bacterium]|tara:strand:- start:1005 stop:1361 length:357 start_codon:yes stop_codon:yes gene_type:complete